MNFKKEKASILRKKQKQLIDEFILDTDKISKIMKNYTQKRGIFHNYSIGNLILAHFQLLLRGNEEGIELLAPYKRWNKINRNVKKGEKALYILAPIIKKIYDEEDPEKVIDTKLYFKKVPVFDLSQTEGEAFEQDLTENKGCNLTFEEIKNKLDIPILESNKILTKGSTNGKWIKISKNLSNDEKICTLFHELGHYYLHFDKNGEKLTRGTEELEAEVISFIVSSAIGITNHESGAYITNWAGENSAELIKGKGTKLINTASKIIDDLQLNDKVLDVENASTGKPVEA